MTVSLLDVNVLVVLVDPTPCNTIGLIRGSRVPEGAASPRVR